MKPRGPKGGGPKGGGPKGGGPNPEKVGARRVGPEGWGPEGWGPEGWGAQNFALFCSLSRRKIRSFLPSLGVFSLNFGGVLKTKTLKCARLEFSGCRVRAPAARSGGAAGVSHDSQRAQTCTFEGLGLQNTTKIQREDTQRGKKRTNFAAGEGQKRAKFWAVQGKDGPRKGVPNQTLKPTPTHETPL